MAPQHYMKYEVQQFYYSEIQKRDPLAVDSFWLNLLPDYFRKSDMFGIEKPPPQFSEQELNWTFRYIRNGHPKVILVQDRREDGEPQVSAWPDALELLTKHLHLVRKQRDQTPNDILYGVVNIGTFTRFYQIQPDDDSCVDYVSKTTEYKGQQLELLKDEVRIHQLLTELAEKTKR